MSALALANWSWIATEGHACGAQVRAREKVAAEQMQKAQTIARDARTYVKRQAAAYEQHKAQLAKKMEEVHDRWTIHSYAHSAALNTLEGLGLLCGTVLQC